MSTKSPQLPGSVTPTTPNVRLLALSLLVFITRPVAYAYLSVS
jgi:hypothetical protein